MTGEIKMLREINTDLYEALEWLLATSTALHSRSDVTGWGSVLKARAALAKARREETK